MDEETTSISEQGAGANPGWLQQFRCRGRRVLLPGGSALAFGEHTTLAFDVTRVDCTDALGGEILQVSFDTAPEDQDEDERSTPYVYPC